MVLHVAARERISGPRKFRWSAQKDFCNTLCHEPTFFATYLTRETAIRYAKPMPLEFLISALVTMVVVVDPLGLVPTFVAITHGLPSRSRCAVALRACLIAAAILAGAALIGDRLLRGRCRSAYLPSALRRLLCVRSVGNGVRVRIERQSKEAEEAIEEHVRNIAAFPLAIPLMAGPGAIAATILLAGRANGDPVHLSILLAVVAAVLGLCFVMFLLAAHIATLVGTTVSVVLSRLLGVLLAALAVQFVIDGVRTALAG